MAFQRRTDTVPYEEIFKTRLRVIDDRSPSQNTNYSEPKTGEKTVDHPATSQANSNHPSVRSSPVQKSTGRASPLVKSDYDKLSYKKVAWDAKKIKVESEQDSFKKIMTTSELLVLPELEIKYLEQYQLHTNYIMNINDKVDYLGRKVKEIKKFINDRVEEEQEALIPQIIKIQALFRGYLCRKKLIDNGLPTFKRKRYYPDIEKANKAAFLIQAIWRGYIQRKTHGTRFQIDLLKSTVERQSRLIKLQGNSNVSKLSKDVNMLKMVVTSQQEEIAKFEKLNRSISQNNQELLSIFKELQHDFFSLKDSVLEINNLKGELGQNQKVRAPSSEQVEFLNGIEEGILVNAYVQSPI
ncbi:hypothetical protein HDV01_000308 [Terramyces sp. JEL0728]|nr:hypothetical protein HDV01_000308 [Terramyces sp. JEL0728]